MLFETIHSELLFEGRVFTLRSDQVRLPDGQVTRLDIVVHGGAVVLVPVDTEGNIWFVRQYRHAAEVTLVELPAGALEPGEDVLECAQRELREEIGMSAALFQKLGTFYLAPGYSTEQLHIFLAQGLSPDPLPGDVDEFLSVEKIPVAEVYTMASEGIIQDAKTLASLLLAQAHLLQ